MWLTLAVEWEGRLTAVQQDRPMSSKQVFTIGHAIHYPRMTVTNST
jgi:hypothetical protein